MKILLIDDLREMDVCGGEDLVARNYWDGIEALKQGGWDLLLLDHDIASFDADGKEKTGYDVLCFLEEFPEYLPKEIKIVSQNSVGRQRMQAVIKKLYSKN